VTPPEMNSKAPVPGETGVGMTTIIPLIAACTVAYLSWTTQPFQFTILSDQTQFGPVLAGGILSAEICVAAIVSIIVGFAGGIRVTRSVLLTGTLLCLIGDAIVPQLTSFGAVLLARLLSGVGEGLLIAAVNIAVAGLENPEKCYGQINGILNLLSFGVVWGTPIAISYIGAPRPVYLVIAIATIILGLIVTLYRTSPFHNRPSQQSKGIGGWRGWTICGAVLVFAAAVGSFYPVTETLGKSAGINDSSLDIALSLAFIGAILGSYWAAWVDKRVGQLGVAIFAAAGAAVAVATLVHARQGIVFSAGMFAFGAFWFQAYTSCLGFAADLDAKGGCAAACGGAFFLGGGLGPLIGGYELDWGKGYYGIFTWAVCAQMLAFLLLRWIAQRKILETESLANIHGQ
jgi:predicted MFS family arabinose efflux permease